MGEFIITFYCVKKMAVPLEVQKEITSIADEEICKTYHKIALKKNLFADTHLRIKGKHFCSNILNSKAWSDYHMKKTHSKENVFLMCGCYNECYSKIYPYCISEQRNRYFIESNRLTRIQTLYHLHNIEEAKELFDKKVEKRLK